MLLYNEIFPPYMKTLNYCSSNYSTSVSAFMNPISVQNVSKHRSRSAWCAKNCQNIICLQATCTSRIWMTMEHWWNDSDRGKLGHCDRNLSQYHFFHHKRHMDWSGIESRPIRLSNATVKFITHRVLWNRVPCGILGLRGSTWHDSRYSCIMSSFVISFPNKYHLGFQN